MADAVAVSFTVSAKEIPLCDGRESHWAYLVDGVEPFPGEECYGTRGRAISVGVEWVKSRVTDRD